MPSDCISYQESGYFTKLIVDYLNREDSVRDLYHRFPSIEEFKGQILEKQQSFTQEKRNTLANAIQGQYKNVDASLATLKNIDRLRNENCFTITTGHQLNLFTGPLYFLYKIISAINLSQELKAAYPDQDFVPVYWMATEDHDFEEINYFTVHGKKLRWNRESAGAVGRLSTQGLEDVFQLFSLEIGNSNHAEELKKLFQQAYLEHDNLTDATRFLANSLFASYGLVIVDGDDAELKKQFIPYLWEDATQQTAFHKVNETLQKFGNYTVQVNPREINSFYLDEKLRSRIVKTTRGFEVLDSDYQFTESQLKDLLEAHPEKFSPNVILRPLYQEVILPNLCYIGGGGEIAYWLELKLFFESQNVPFPILLVRNGALLASEKQNKKRQALDLSWSEMFMKLSDLENHMARRLSAFPIDLSQEKQLLEKQFQELFALADKTDPSFSGAVKAQQAKQLKGLEHLEKRLLKAQKRMLKDSIDRVIALRESLFPNGGLQERQTNFSEIYLETGNSLIPLLTNTLKPLNQQFDILIY